MKKLIAILTLVISLSGCVGVVTLYPESTIYRAPFTQNVRFTDSAGTLRSTNTSTQEDFLLEWGEPSDKEVGEQSESWRYHRGKEMCGVILGLIIPIPLILPVCNAEDRIVFQRGSATSITILRPTDAGIMCGLFVNGLHGGSDLCSK